MHKKILYHNAVAIIKGGDAAPALRGRVEFYQKSNGVLVVVNVDGLPKDNESGFFAFHIHEGKSCQGDDFAETLAHYNPQSTPHPMHAGDLPPLLECNGMAYMSVLTGRFSVKEIIGRTVVIHNGVDDFTTQPAGNAGRKIACGIIKLI